MIERDEMTRSARLRTQFSDYRAWTRKNLLHRTETGGWLSPSNAVLRWLAFVSMLAYLGGVIF